MIPEPALKWTRPGYVLGLVLLLWGYFMAVHLSRACGKCSLQGGLTSPMLAVELAIKPAELKGILFVESNGECGALCRKKTAELQVQQTYDRFLIFLYAAFYLYFALLNFRFGGPAGWILGAAIAALALAGAVFDWSEDNRILDALAGLSPSMREPAYRKWLCLSIATGLAAPLFARWPTPSLALKLLRLGIVLTALSTASSGILGFWYCEDLRIEAAAKSMGGTLVLSVIFLWTVQFWRVGTHAALDRIADLPVLHVIADWPPDEEAAASLKQEYPTLGKRLASSLRRRTFTLLPRP